MAAKIDEQRQQEEADTSSAICGGPLTSSWTVKTSLRAIGIPERQLGDLIRFSGYGGIICPAAWRAAQWGRMSTRLDPTEPAPHLGKRRFSGIAGAGQQRRHQHGHVVVAVQA